jgi:glycosyltransferase involved in cell wall biosynthesis
MGWSNRSAVKGCEVINNREEIIQNIISDISQLKSSSLYAIATGKSSQILTAEELVVDLTANGYSENIIRDYALRSNLQQDIFFIDNFLTTLKNFPNIPEHKKFYIQPTKAEIFAFSNEFFKGDNRFIDIIQSLFEKLTPQSSVFVRNSNFENTIIQESNSTSFNLLLQDPSFIDKTVVNAKVIIAEAFLDYVANIDQILQWAFKTKEPVVLLARRMSEEVINTIRVNNKKGNFQIVPLTTHYDVERINVLVDFAIACGAKITSADKGELPTLINPAEGPIRTVKITQNGVSVDFKMNADIAQHLSILTKKYSDVRDPVLAQRISSFSSHKLDVFVSKHLDFENGVVKLNVFLANLLKLLT